MILVVLIAVYGLLIRPRIGTMIGTELGDQFGLPTAVAVTPQPGLPPPAQEAVDEAVGALPELIAALPAGELVVSDTEANSFLAERQDDYAPLDSINLQFTGGEVAAEVRAYGLSGTAHTGLAAQDGRVVLLNPQIDGALGLVVSAEELVIPLADRLNAELARQGRTVDEVRIEEGQIVLVTSGS